MSTESTSTDDEAVRVNQATDWFVRLFCEDVSESDLAEWLRWCSDPSNVREFRRVCDIWTGVDHLRVTASRLLGASACPVTPQGVVEPPRVVVRERPSTRHRLHRVAVAAAVAGAGIFGLWVGHDVGWSPSTYRLTPSTAPSRSTILPDGSTLTLAPRTQVDVDFSGPTRRLSLSPGEAYFKVHPDKRKPFVVRTGDVTVTAVGTAFDVRSEPGRAVVTVQEGVVTVVGMRSATQMSGTWRVTAGYQVLYDTNSREVRLSAVDPTRALDWRDGRLRYFDEPLDAVVNDVNRFSERPIKVADPAVGRFRFTGTIFLDSIDDWISAIQSTFPIHAVVTRDNRVLLMDDASSPGTAHTVH